MTLRPPQILAPKPTLEGAHAALHYEIAQEKASVLGRLGRALEAALATLEAFDGARGAAGANAPSSGAAGPTPIPLDDAARADRRALVTAAGKALWHLVIQREILGLRDTGRLLRDYRVPDEVRDRMGAG